MRYSGNWVKSSERAKLYVNTFTLLADIFHGDADSHEVRFEMVALRLPFASFAALMKSLRSACAALHRYPSLFLSLSVAGSSNSTPTFNPLSSRTVSPVSVKSSW